MKRWWLALAFSWLLIGCQTLPTGERWARTELYFGLSKPDGSYLANEDWDRFLNEEVTPRFPAGLSVVEAAGQWRNSSGRIEQEPSKVLVLFHPANPAATAEIDRIRSKYRQMFDQEAVMKVTTLVDVSFIEAAEAR